MSVGTGWGRAIPFLGIHKLDFRYSVEPAETQIKSQVTWHNFLCLPSMLGEGDKRIEMVYGEEKNILYWAD